MIEIHQETAVQEFTQLKSTTSDLLPIFQFGNSTKTRRNCVFTESSKWNDFGISYSQGKLHAIITGSLHDSKLLAAVVQRLIRSLIRSKPRGSIETFDSQI